MNKHNQPYKCLDPDCNKMQGFTYSEGLLRHQHEVHGMHARNQKLMCPYPDCNQSSGKGFTRQENLKEHLWHLHRGGDGTSSEVAVPLQVDHPSKRSWQDLTPPSSSDENNNTASPQPNHSKRWQQELTAPTPFLDHQRIRELKNTVKELQQTMKRFQQTIMQLSDSALQQHAAHNI